MIPVNSLLWTILSFGFAPFLGLVSGVLIARFFGPVGRGELAALQALPMFLTMVAHFGLGHAITYATARSPESSRHIFYSSVIFCILWCVPICLAGFNIQQSILSNYRTEIIYAGTLFLLFIPLNVLNGLPWSILQGKEQFMMFSLLRIQPQFIYCLVIVSAITFNKQSILWIVELYLLSIILICIPSSWIAIRSSLKGTGLGSIALLRKLLSYGMFSMLGYLPSMLNQRIDQLFMAVLIKPEQLGLYAVAASYSLLVVPIASGIGTTILPRLAQSEKEYSSKDISYALRWSLVSIVSLTTFLIVLAPFIVPLVFGPVFIQAIPATIILCFGAVAYAMNQILAETFRGIGRPGVASCSELIGLVITITGLLFFLKPYGILAACWISVISYFISLLYYLITLRANIPSVFSGWPTSYYTEAILLWRQVLIWCKLRT